jgi:hypothetical protein
MGYDLFGESVESTVFTYCDASRNRMSASQAQSFGKYTALSYRMKRPQHLVAFLTLTSAPPCAGHQYIAFLQLDFFVGLSLQIAPLKS